MSGYQEIDAATLHAMLDGSTKPLLVDVRSGEETSRGIIAGALRIPLQQLASHIAELDSDAPLVFYCHSGMRSAQAGMFLAGLGRDNVYNLRGGILAWGMAGYTLQPPPME